MRALDMLGAYYVRKANQEKNKDKRSELLNKAAQLYTTADKIMMYDIVSTYDCPNIFQCFQYLSKYFVNSAGSFIVSGILLLIGR